MKQSYGQTFQQVKRCYTLTSIRPYEFNIGVSNIGAHGKGEEADVPGSCSMGFLLDQKSLKTRALHVKRSFTCCSHVELCQEVVNFKNEVDKEEEAMTFGEEFHTLGHIFLCIEHAHGLQVQNGHIELSMVLTKLGGIVPILVC